ncbi:MAG: 4Fe-4S binding protein [Lachnospiraceae bacterium]|jgi:NADH:ubiquinone oxidoreductase subunit F (NADH-binding)/NAD-dependent dihydropyrimidine dehydrogenase PreA subunit|nr:4Fe-4S binding protein [Lachnospiraceae bacterium]
MGAFETAKGMSKEEVIEKIKAAGLREFGVYNQDLAKKWEQDLAEKENWDASLKVIAALNNNDTNHALLELLKTSASDVIEGIKIAAYALDAEGMQLYLPEGEDELKDSLSQAASEAGIELCQGIVNVRDARGCSLNHIETMAALGALFAGAYTPGSFITVCKDGKNGELTKVVFPAKVGDIAGVSPEEIKGILIGSNLYDASGLDLVLEEDTNIGNGVITILPADCCIIDQEEKLLLGERKNGCGRCTFCREGLGQLHAMAKEITEGKGKNEYLAMMEEIGNAMTFSCQCSVGQTGADFTLGSLKYFGNEYTDHIKKKKCAADVCSSFMSIYIDPNLCEGCEECADVCPAECIEGKSGFIHMIDEFDCTKCGKCIEACEYDAVIKTTGRVPKLPTRLTKCGKFKKR